ncbi:MAG TPA: hypothetical protein PLW44_06475, partial [Chitinophagales bacterium]|nr:hypothetical protein [Chitinophagales bacterium]
AATGGYPLNLIYSNGTVAYPNNNINITNNEIYNFGCFGGASNRRAYGINVTATGNGGNWTISGNSIYSTYIDGTGYQTCINFIPGASSNNNVINDNYLGGRAPLCGGLAMTNNTSSDFIGIAINAGNGTGTTIQGNTIQNMLADYGDGSGITAIDVAGSTRVNITGNTIGHATLVNSLQSDGGSTSLSVASGWVYGVYSATSSPISITNNTIAGLASVGIYNSYVNIIEHAGTGAATITGNTMGRTYSSGSSSGYNTKGIVVTSNATGHNISDNTLTFIGNGSSGAISGPTADAIQVSSTGGGVIANNTIDGLFNVGNGGYSVGIWVLGSGNWTVSNNMLNLLNYSWLGTYTTRKEFYGILDYTTGGSVKYYYNTVLVQGSQTGTSSFDYPSECFYKLPGGSGSGSGGATELKNNIFINSRTGNPSGSTKHYAIDNTSSTPGTNWVSNNNFLSTVNNATLGYWTGAGDVDFANWKSNTGGDANSTSAQATTGTSSSTAANPAELFVAPLTGNLHINTTPPNAPYPYDFVSNRGVTVSTTTDLDGDVRTSTPDIGADEFLICTTPVISANTPTNPTCTGNDGSIALTGLAANTTFSVTYNRNATPVSAANYTSNGSGVLTITGLDGGTYNNIVLSLGAGCSSAAYPASGSITLTNPVCGPNTWQGDVVGAGTDWFNNGNWSTGVAPTSCADNVVIPTNPIGSNFPVISGASAQVGNITVQSGATISIDNARTLSVCGDFTGSSTATASTVTGAGKVVLTGSAAQAVSGRTTFSTLQVAKTGGSVATVQSGSNLSVTTALELASGNLTNSGNLTLKSTATTHAIFNDFGAPVGTYTGTYTGTINEERYYRATSANSYNQHYMGSPVANATLAQFGAGGSSGAVTPTADCSETQLDQTSVYGSVFSYNEADGATCPMKSWNVKAGSTTATPAQGFSVAKTGAGTLTVSGTPNTATSYAVAGLTNSNWTKGTLQHPSTTAFGSGWHMVSNPYNATLDLTSITPPAGFDNQIQVWDVIQGQYYTLTGTKLIAPFQAFFVHKTSPGGSATYTIDGNWRVATPATFYAQSIPEQLTITATNTSNQLYDVTTVGFNQSATDQFDAQYDANKLTGSIGRHNLSTQNNGYELNTNILSSIQTTSTVNMTFEPGSAGTYTLTFDGLNSFDPTSYIMLEDKQLNTMHDARSGDYTFTATA